MSIIKYEPVHIGDFSSFIENLVSKTKSKRFRAGFMKKAPRNISYQRLLWISVGKKIWGVSQFRLADEHIRLYVLNPTKYSQLKNLLIGNLDGSTAH
jgi:hypothetical protein